MKYIKSLLISCLIILINCQSFAAVNEEIFPQEKKILEVVVKILNSSHSSRQAEMWPGYDLTESPVIITFSTGHVYAFNLKSANPDWQKINIDGTKVLFSQTDHWGLTKTAFNPQFPLEGQQVYVFNLDQASKNAVKPFQILVHERFHRHEFDHFAKTKSGHYEDHLNVENLALGKLEETALGDFMKAKGDSAQQMQYLRDFIAINSTRRALIKSCSQIWEDHQQIMEGLADYVSYRILDAFDIIKEFDGHRELGLLLDFEAANPDYSDHAIKWRHYGIGNSLGYALDFLKVPHWKERVENEGTSLAQLLDESIKLSPEEIEVRMEQCKVLYDWENILEMVEGSVHQFEEEVSGYIKDYQKMEGVVLEVGRPKAGVSGSGSNERMLYLEDGTTLSLKDTLASTSEDNLWRLNLEAIPYVFKKSRGALEFKVESETEIILDQQRFKLKDLLAGNLQKPFKSIELQGKACRLISEKHPGVLIIQNGKVRIIYP